MPLTALSIALHEKALDDDSRLKSQMIKAFWPHHRILRAHEFEWHRAVTAISKSHRRLLNLHRTADERHPVAIRASRKPAFVGG